MQQTGNSTRKKFLLWGAALFSSATLFKIFSGSKKSKPTEHSVNTGTTKLLTQDGKLVEVDKKLLTSGSRKISDQELQQWIKN
ncbi:MAG: hypothetical protein ACRDEB_01305 [Chitinophagaceae bacterium]